MMIPRFFIQLLCLCVSLLLFTDYVEVKWLRGRRRVESESIEKISLIHKLPKSEEDIERLRKRKLFHMCGNNELDNGDAELNSTLYWQASYCKIEMVSPGYGDAGSAFKIYDHEYHGSGLLQQLDPTCILASDYTWRIQARVKMYDRGTGDGISCDPRKVDENCPHVIIILHRYGENIVVPVHDADMVWNPDDWNAFDALFKTTPENSGNAIEYFGMIFQGSRASSVITLVDDLTFERLEEWETPTIAPTLTIEPSAAPSSYCSQNFAKNPDFESGSNYHWFGIGGTPIDLESPGYGGSAYAIKASGRSNWFSGPIQDLDHSCLTVGSAWKLEAKFKIYEESTGVIITDCNQLATGDSSCPYGLLQTTKFGQENRFDFLRDLDTRVYEDGWYSFSSTITMTSVNAGPEITHMKLLLVGGPPGSVLLVDNIRIHRLEVWEMPTAAPTRTHAPTSPPTNYCNRNWVSSSDFENESVHGFVGFGATLGIASPGADGSNYALSAMQRPGSEFGAFLWSLDLKCLEEGSVWLFEFKARLLDEATGQPVRICFPTSKNNNCPHVRIMSRHNGLNYWAYIYDMEMEWKPDEWSLFSTKWTLPDALYSPDITNFFPFFVGGPLGSQLIIDDVKIQRLSRDLVPTSTPSVSVMPSTSPTVFCSKSFLRNGDGEFGTTSYWMGWDNSIDVEEPGFGGLGYALKAYDRNSWHRGLSQVIDYSCLTIGSSWRFQMQVKLYDQTTGAGITTCVPSDPTNIDCPLIRLTTKKNQEDHFTLIQDTEMEWDPNNWNKFDVVVTFTEENSGPDITWMLPIYAGGPPNSVLLIDDAKIERLETWETPTASPTRSDPPSQSPTGLCTKNFLKNNDARTGSLEYWTSWLNPIGVKSPGYGGTDYVFMAYQRSGWERGIGQWLDYSCISLNSTLHFQAKVMLYDEETGIPTTTCDPRDILAHDCPMVRLVTAMENGANHFDVYRDTDMAWNPNGWSDFDINVLLTPDNSGDDLVKFFPNFVGGPAGSVLVIDKISITLTTDENMINDAFEAAKAAALVPPILTCHSIGDPHIKSFNGTKFDNHSPGWHVLFEKDTIKVESYHDYFLPEFSAAMSNTKYRISYQNVTVAEGEDGAIPDNNDGIIFLYEPMTWVKIQANEMHNPDSAITLKNKFIYNIFITTSHYEGSFGLCSDREEIQNETPELPADLQVSDEQAKTICMDFLDTELYDDCIADAIFINNLDFIGGAANMAAGASIAETQIRGAIENKPDDITEEEERLIANTVPAETVVGDGIGRVIPGLVEAADDGQLTSAARSLEADVEAEGAAMEEVQSGVNGDPLIMGLHHQAFNFDGKSDSWYANVATDEMQWNMKFHDFYDCPRDDSMYVTAMAISVNKTTGTDFANGESHNIMISIKNESEVFPGCPPPADPGDPVCLGEGSLQVIVDGTVYDEAGDHRISNNLRIVSHNTYDACSRKWYDYDKGIHLREDEGGIFRRLLGNRQRKLFSTKDPMDFVRNARQYMVAPHLCTDWIERRTRDNNLFEQLGGWSTIYIETPVVSFQVEYRQIRKDKSGVGGGTGLPQDMEVHGLPVYGTQKKCISHVLDAWLTHANPKMRGERWDGILGETRTLRLNDEGYEVLENRDLLLMGSDVDYEVGSAFGRDFPARDLNLEWRKLLARNSGLLS